MADHQSGRNRGCRTNGASSGTTGRWDIDPLPLRHLGGRRSLRAGLRADDRHVSRRSLVDERRWRPRAGDDLGAVADPASGRTTTSRAPTSCSTLRAISIRRATPTRWRSATTASRCRRCIRSIRSSRGRWSAPAAKSSTSSPATTSSRRHWAQSAGSATPGNLVVPARDVLHIKLEAKPGEPLVGIPPLRHAAAAIAAQNAIGSQLISFFANMSRPSGDPVDPLNLTEAQIKRLRERWNEQSRGSQCRRRADPDQRPQVPGHVGLRQGRRDGGGAEADAGRNLHGLRRAAGHPRHDRQGDLLPRPRR